MLKPRLEPRILLEDLKLSHRASLRRDDDIFDNRLIFGDNLLALKALEQEFTNSIKCMFIDPPYNTGSAFAQYDDGLEHSIWLSLMRDRLELLHRLLSNDGSLWITIDDNESHYLKVLLMKFSDALTSWVTSFGKRNRHHKLMLCGFQIVTITFWFLQRIKVFGDRISCSVQQRRTLGTVM